jgi:hypothetical protein
MEAKEAAGVNRTWVSVVAEEEGWGSVVVVVVERMPGSTGHLIESFGVEGMKATRKWKGTTDPTRRLYGDETYVAVGVMQDSESRC